MKALFSAARLAAKPGKGERQYTLGAVAIRADGAVVSAANGSPPGPEPKSHAEQRALRKAGQGAVLIVARVRKDGSLGLALPCKRCQALIKSKGVTRVWYSVGGLVDFASYVP